MFKKKDLIFALIVLLLAGVLYLFHEMTGDGVANKVVVTVDGETLGYYDLNKNQTIEINDGSNILKIQDGKANMSEAVCPDKLCVNQRAISKSNESIICLPNKVVVKVVAGNDSDAEDEYDTIAK